MTTDDTWAAASPSLRALILRLACDGDDSAILSPGGWRSILTIDQALEVLK